MQITSFLRKEAVDVIRQPRLLLTLVIGPFLIMAVFAVGYRDNPARLNALFVTPAGSPLRDQVKTYAGKIGGYVHYVGTSSDMVSARKKLEDGKVDVLVVFPDKVMETLMGGKRAMVTVVHTRLDPIEQTAIFFASELGIDRMNATILAKVVASGQQQSEPAGRLLARAGSAIKTLDEAVVSGDNQRAQHAADEVDRLTAQVALTVRALSALGQFDSAGNTASLDQSVNDMRDAAVTVRQRVTTGGADNEIARLRNLLDTVTHRYQQFSTIDPDVMVRPFDGKTELDVKSANKVTDWYAPAAIVLMLQQFGVAFGALSFVRERQLGIADVLRVAPVNATETLIGKYLAYMAIGGSVAAVLTGMVVGLLGVPLSSNVRNVAIVMALSLFASIGLGLVISLASSSDAQAVQYTMILLLASLFFSGFFLSIGQMEGPAKYMGWLLPVTYGMQLLRDVMLRGAEPDRILLVGLALYGTAAFLLALLGTRRRMSSLR